jgi:transcriptional regulator with XRE-family HTH domain
MPTPSTVEQITRMKRARLQRRLSQLEVSRRSRTAPSDVSRWERGLAIPYPGQAARVARVLGESPDQLLDLVDA